MSQTLTLRYQWPPHSPVNLRRLGESFMGIERIVSLGMFAIETGRFSKGREQLPLAIRATALRPGSSIVECALDVVGASMPILQELVTGNYASILPSWVMGVLNTVADRQSESERNLAQVLQFLDKVEQNRHDEIMAIMNSKRFVYPAYQAVATVEPGASMSISGDQARAEEADVDISLAEDIRTRNGTRSGPIETIRVKVDGFSHNSQHLKIEDPQEPGRFITARVLDPDFVASPNIYTSAASIHGYLEIRGKAVRRDGRIQMFYIMHAEPAS